MKYVIRIIVVLLFFLSYSYANQFLDVTEFFFKKMKEHSYIEVFDLLTKKSKNTIVDDVYEAVSKNGLNLSRDSIYYDFNNGGDISKNYWSAFLKNFNPDMVLNESQWSTGKCDNEYCEIIIQYKKSQRPAYLKIFKEDNKWKIGLVESFWTRKK